MNKTKKYFLIVSFPVLFLLGFYINLNISNNCKTLKIFQSVIDFGINHIDNCYSKDNLVTSIKQKLSNTPLLYEIARKIRRNYVTKNYILDNPLTLKEIDYVKKQELVFQNIQKPFIQGIINNNENLFKSKKKFMSLKIGIGLMESTQTQNLTQILK